MCIFTKPEVPPEGTIKQLHNSQHPHQWQLRENLTSNKKCFIEHLKITLEESSLLRTELPFNYLMKYVALAYEYFVLNDIEKALETLKRGEIEYLALRENENVHDLSSAFSHVLMATKLFFLVQKLDITRASMVVPLIPKIEEMDSKNKAAVCHGFPALFIGSFGLEGIKLALGCLTEAVEMDPTEPIWYYAAAEFVGQLDCPERLTNTMSSDEQFNVGPSTGNEESSYSYFI